MKTYDLQSYDTVVVTPQKFLKMKSQKNIVILDSEIIPSYNPKNVFLRGFQQPKIKVKIDRQEYSMEPTHA